MASNPMDQLIHALSKLPGIGEKTATRLAFYLLREPNGLALELAGSLQKVKQSIRLCSVCCRVTEQNPCAICQDPRRDVSLICVVEEPSDVVALERTARFRGLYHVLHGALSPLHAIGPDDLRIKELLARLESSPVREVVLATNANVEGDATALYLARLLKPMGVKVTRLASGIPVGGELEYLDPSTLIRALEERREV